MLSQALRRLPSLAVWPQYTVIRPVLPAAAAVPTDDERSTRQQAAAAMARRAAIVLPIIVDLELLLCCCALELVLHYCCVGVHAWCAEAFIVSWRSTWFSFLLLKRLGVTCHYALNLSKIVQWY